jgi:hypothetical protein
MSSVARLTSGSPCFGPVSEKQVTRPLGEKFHEHDTCRATGGRRDSSRLNAPVVDPPFPAGGFGAIAACVLHCTGDRQIDHAGNIDGLIGRVLLRAYRFDLHDSFISWLSLANAGARLRLSYRTGHYAIGA